MKKKSAYQKLKDENAELRKMLSIVCLNQESAEAGSIIFNEKVKDKLEWAVWQGTTKTQ